MDKERIARFHGDFYRDQYRKVVHVLFLLSCLALILTCVVGWLLFFKKIPPTYFAAITDGQVVEMKPE